MQFNSMTFLVFFALVLAVFYSLRTTFARKLLLVIASYAFYAAWNPPFVLLLALSTCVDWSISRRIAATSAKRPRLLLLLGSLCVNLGILGYFKYGEFLLENFVAAAHLAGIEYQPPGWSIVLPAGISFYTFQSLSYTIDVYRGHITAKRSLLDYALFVSFFPQLVAGPIVRAGSLLPQFTAIRGATTDQLGWGLCLLLFGVFAKVVLADYLLAPFVDHFYADPSVYGAWEAVFAIAAFSGQIFYDFSAYSTCAVGAAMCFGFALPDNFRAPYAAVGFSDFWRRWHISLSTYLRDYLYIPLGGNRGSQLKVSFNLMTTMLIGGLWHGASWQFVIWGGVHGALLVIERMLRRLFGSAKVFRRRLSQLLLGFGTFCAVSLAWVFFRSPDMDTAEEVFAALTREGTPNITFFGTMPSVFWAVALMLAWHCATRSKTLEDYFRLLDWRARTIVVGVALAAIAFVDLGNEHAFIYFQF